MGWEERAQGQAEPRVKCEINQTCRTSSSRGRGRAGILQRSVEEWERWRLKQLRERGRGAAKPQDWGVGSASPPPSLLRSSLAALRLPRAHGLRFLRLRQRAPGCCFRRQMGDIAALRRVELEHRPPLPRPSYTPTHTGSQPALSVRAGAARPSPAPRRTWPPADPAGGGAGGRAAHTALSGL